MRSSTVLRVLRTFAGGVLAFGTLWGLLYALGRISRSGGAGVAGPEIWGRPVNFAHRGDSSRAPENTIEAFSLGIESGAGGLEMDAHLTSDGEIVVVHDDAVDRTSDGSGLVADMTLEELTVRDAGYRFTLDGQDFPYRGKGIEFSTLSEVYRRFPGVWINVEIKSRSPYAPERMLEVILDAEAADRTVVAASDHAVMRRFRDASGGRVATSASVREIYSFYLASLLGLERLLPIRYVALQVPARTPKREVVTPRFVAAARSRGVAVDVWTINEPQEMKRLLDLGVGVIMTDRPGELDAVIKSRSGG